MATLYWQKILTAQNWEPGTAPQFSLLYQLALVHLKGKSKNKINHSLHSLQDTIATHLDKDTAKLFVEQFKLFSIIVSRRMLPSQTLIPSLAFSITRENGRLQDILKACKVADELPYHIHGQANIFKIRQFKKELELVKRISLLYDFKISNFSLHASANLSFFGRVFLKISDWFRFIFNLEIPSNHPEFSEYCDRMSSILTHPTNSERTMHEAQHVVSLYYQRLIESVQKPIQNHAGSNSYNFLFTSAIEELKQLRLLGILTIKKALITSVSHLNGALMSEFTHAMERWQLVFPTLESSATLHPTLFEEKLTEIKELVTQMKSDWDSLITPLNTEENASPNSHHHFLKAMVEESKPIKSPDTTPPGKAPAHEESIQSSYHKVFKATSAQAVVEEESDFARSMRERKEEKETIDKIIAHAKQQPVILARENKLREDCLKLLKRKIEREIVNQDQTVAQETFKDFSSALDEILVDVKYIYESIENEVVSLLSTISDEKLYPIIQDKLEEYISNHVLISTTENMSNSFGT